MRMSCNGCRVLRKGCSENCSIRPCLQLFKSAESQANATVFLAKFYGRAGLLNLINAGPDDLRPAIFRSLLYEACGRIVNPIYGSAGLLCSGSWDLCQAAVDAVLKGAPIAQISSETAAASNPPPPLKPYDIRHVSKDPLPARAAADIHRVSNPRPRFKRSAAKLVRPGFQREQSNESAFSADTAEASHVSQGEPHAGSGREEGEVELELTLGFEPAGSGGRPDRGPVEKQRFAVNQLGFGLELHAG